MNTFIKSIWIANQHSLLAVTIAYRIVHIRHGLLVFDWTVCRPNQTRSWKLFHDIDMTDFNSKMHLIRFSLELNALEVLWDKYVLLIQTTGELTAMYAPQTSRWICWVFSRLLLKGGQRGIRDRGDGMRGGGGSEERGRRKVDILFFLSWMTSGDSVWGCCNFFMKSLWLSLQFKFLVWNLTVN